MRDVDLPVDFLDNIQATINTFSLISRSMPTIVALSGGKDSVALLIALRRLQYSVIPVTVDMGYEPNWGRRITALAAPLGSVPEIIEARGSGFQAKLDQSVRADLESRLVILDELGRNSRPNVTPCTHCYNSKLIALRAYAEANKINTIAFAHHATDALASFLKSALMYIDRWDNDNPRFQRDRFAALVDSSAVTLSATSQPQEIINSILYQRLKYLAENRFASTDEPPRQHVESTLENLQIVRPLFSIQEDDIEAIRDEAGLETEGSGCGHGQTKSTETPREMIHNRILRPLSRTNTGHTIQQALMTLARLGLNGDGTLVFNARNRRADLLGQEYREDFGCGMKL